MQLIRVEKQNHNLIQNLKEQYVTANENLTTAAASLLYTFTYSTFASISIAIKLLYRVEQTFPVKYNKGYLYDIVRNILSH